MLDSISDLHHLLFVPQRVPLAMAAILLVSLAGIVTGPLLGYATPLFWTVVGKTIGVLGGRLDRVQRRAGDLLFRGMILTLLSLVLFYIVSGEATLFARRMPMGGFTEIALLSLTLSAGTVWFGLLRLYFTMKNKKTGANAYHSISKSARVDLSGSDLYTMTRVGMGFCARTFDKGLVTPTIWYLIAGLPGAMIYAGLAALAWRFGRDGFTKGFGQVALALERLMGFVPHFLAGFLMAVAGLLTPTGGMTRAIIGLMRPGKGHAPYVQGGVPVTAMAYALHVALGGPVVDPDGIALKNQWVGPDKATAQLESGHLRRALYISLMAHLLFLAGLGTTLLFAL